MSKESMIVLGAMIALVAALIGIRTAYDDISALFYAPTAAETADENQALDELRQWAEAHDPGDLIASAGPCAEGSDRSRACLTVTANWQRASGRQQAAADFWRGWADLCTKHQLAGQARDCHIELHSESGDRVGGSGDADGSRIWVKE